MRESDVVVVFSFDSNSDVVKGAESIQSFYIFDTNFYSSRGCSQSHHSLSTTKYKKRKQLSNISVMKQKHLKQNLVRLWVFLGLLFIFADEVCAQSVTVEVKGQVLAATDNEPLLGVTVREQGTGNGVVTDLDGNFSITVKNGATVTFSYINYITQQYKANAVPAKIFLREETKNLDEVVVVGYGQQKKVNLSGSVSAINGDKIAAQPASDAVSALQGQLPGVTVLRSSGQPGSESSGMRIRGFSSVNSTSTLVLIDGVEGDLALVNADDIESISVLKDAAASAIYGARAAAGVVLVTTKNGKAGKPRITYSGYLAVNTPGNMPERLPAWEEQDMINQGRINAGGKPEWNPEQSSWIGNPNFNYRPNNNNGRWDLFEATNWVAEGTRDYMVQQNHAMSVSGGAKSIAYMFTANYYTKNGLLRYGPNGNERWNMGAKVNAKVNKYITLGTNLLYQSTRVSASSYGAGNILSLLYSSRGRQPIYNPAEDDQLYNGDLQANAIQIMKEGGANNSRYEAYTGKVALKVDNLLEGLHLQFSASRKVGYYNQSSVRRTLVWYDRLGTSIRQQVNNPNSLYKQKNSDHHDLLEATATYHLKVGKQHDFTLLAGTSYENYRKDQMDATAKNMNSNDFFSFNYYDTSVVTNTELGDTVSPWSMMSYFGRFNYNFLERYLFEANVRYDGSSRLAPEKRWKAFPSLSAAWRINQEGFLKDVKWIDNLKLRLSWGQLGNGAILGLYDYIPTISDSQGGRPATYLGEKWYYQAQLASTEKTWETIETTNVGIDFGLFQGRLTASMDYYWKYNNDMLSSLRLPHVIGVSVPKVNVGKLKTWGWDFEIAWRDHIRDFKYQISFNLSDSRNRLLKYDGASVIGEGNVWLLEGYELNTIWGYKTQGYWASRDEYLKYKAEHPGYQTFNDGKIAGGDTRYIAQGEADHQLGVGGATPEKPGDLVYLGNSNARYLYGCNISAQWKGFDFSMMFQGVGKRNILIDAAAIAPFYNTYQMPWTIHRDYWTEEHQNAYWPRLYNYSGNNFNFKPSDKWMQDASYIRLKNITLGYTISVAKKYVEKVRVYLSGNDVWEHTELLKVFDPEVGNNAGRNYYPFFRTWAFGINVTF